MMRYALKKLETTGQKAYIETHGEAVWLELADEHIDWQTWTIADMLGFDCLSQFAPSTKRTICRIVLLNVLAQYESKPELCPIIRISHTKWGWRE